MIVRPCDGCGQMLMAGQNCSCVSGNCNCGGRKDEKEEEVVYLETENKIDFIENEYRKPTDIDDIVSTLGYFCVQQGFSDEHFDIWQKDYQNEIHVLKNKIVIVGEMTPDVAYLASELQKRRKKRP